MSKDKGVSNLRAKTNAHVLEERVKELGGRYYRVKGVSVVDGNLIQTMELDNLKEVVAVYRSYGKKDETIEVTERERAGQII